MKLQLVSCDAKRPDKRAIAKVLEEYAGLDSGTASELTGYLLEGTPIDIEVSEGTSSSAFRALRKLDVDYEIVE